MDGASILHEVRDTYLGFRTYVDVGTVETVPPVGKTPIEFKTHFIRPAKFRFQWRSWHPYFGKEHPPDDSVVWIDGSNSYLRFLDKLTKEERASYAIAGATGVSSGSILMVLKLLLPECIELRSTWYDMAEIEVVGVEEVSGQPCHHLVGSCSRPGDTEAWISKNDFRVWRLREHVKIEKKDGRAREYFHDYNYLQISIDEPIAEEIFIPPDF